jgi:uncharacterized lipoprotein NlpE involved in copper resistance
MSKRHIGSIDLTALGDAVRAGHSAVTTANNGKKYASIVIWENDTADQYGNTISIQLQAQKDSQEAKVYVGRAKPPLASVQAATAPAADDGGNDLPF